MSYRFIKSIAPVVGLAGIAVYQATPSNVLLSPEEARQREDSIYYRNCEAVRLAGKAPLHRGDPGYREGIDGDSDGVACEPYYGN